MEINKHQNEYRLHKRNYKDIVLKELNEKVDGFEFSIRTGTKANLETDLTIEEDNIPLEDKGKGRQCFIKTEFALSKGQSENKIDILLLEEPENHLSHVMMKRLIQTIDASVNHQLFITTHSNMVCSRLDLKKAILLNSNTNDPIPFGALSLKTAEFFMKAPDNNVLEMILSSKVILVEGDAEFILIEAFFKNVTGNDLEGSGVHVISVNGTSFKRYLELANLLKIKVAVIRDNDGNPQENCDVNYVDFTNDKAKIFFDEDKERSTFEISLYQDNTTICENLFAAGRRTLSVQEYMLGNKTEATFELLDKKADELKVPTYIQEAIQWISQ